MISDIIQQLVSDECVGGPLVGVIKAARKVTAHNFSPGRIFQDTESIRALNDLIELREKLSDLDKEINR